MLGNFTILDAPQVIVAGVLPAIGAFADGQNKVALGKTSGVPPPLTLCALPADEVNKGRLSRPL